MGCKNDQIDCQTDTGFRKGRKMVKRQTAKLARRLGKKLLEDAPPRNTRGWLS